MENFILALSAAGWCYECNSNHPGCRLPIDAVAIQYHKTPCNGQCYTRIVNGRKLLFKKISFIGLVVFL